VFFRRPHGQLWSSASSEFGSRGLTKALCAHIKLQCGTLTPAPSCELIAALSAITWIARPPAAHRTHVAARL